MRFPLEVFDAVRAAFPADRAVTMRVSGTDWVDGGWDIEPDDRVCSGAGGARLRRHSRIERRSHSVPADSGRSELPGATRARREEGDAHARDRRRPHYRV